MAEELTHNELLEKLREQIELLQINAESFDKGRTVTTLPIATTIRVLFHDTHQSTSLIKLICDCCGTNKDELEMVSTKAPVKEGTMVLLGDGLYAMSLQNSPDGFKATCVPMLGEATHTKIPFKNWWSERVVRNVSGGYDSPTWLTRKELITLHANKEGGAHIDKTKNEDISQISTTEAFGWVAGFINDEGEMVETLPEVDQKQATIRQICYEVLLSLHNHFPGLFSQEYF